MEKAPEKLTVRPVAAGELPGALVALRYVERYAVGGESLAELVAGCDLYAVMHDGNPVGFFSLLVEGQAAWVPAAVGRCAGIDLTASVIPAIERIAAGEGAKSLGMATVRPGLAAKLRAMGYTGERENMVRALQ